MPTQCPELPQLRSQADGRLSVPGFEKPRQEGRRPTNVPAAQRGACGSCGAVGARGDPQLAQDVVQQLATEVDERHPLEKSHMHAFNIHGQLDIANRAV